MEKNNRSLSLILGKFVIGCLVLVINYQALGQVVGENLVSINNFDDLRSAEQDIIDSSPVFVKSNASLGDGGRGYFRYVSGQPVGTYVDDDGITIVPSNGDGSSAWIREYDGDIHLSWFLGGGSDATSALESAITAASTSQNGGLGKNVFIDTGRYTITQTIVLPNRVGIKGANGRGTVLVASSGFSGSSMFYAHNNQSSMFGSLLSDLMLDADGHANYCVVADAWQETSGLYRVVLQGFNQAGVLIQLGYGGAAYLKFRDLEIFSTVATATDGIRVSPISQVGGFILDIEGASITGTSQNQLPRGIYMENDSPCCEGPAF